MPYRDIEKLKSVKDFDGLVEYLRDELDWPIEVEDAEDITYDYEPKELGIEEKYAAKIKNIKQIRPLIDDQPWGIFYVEFEPKKLPVVVLRRILRALIHSRRNANDRMATWDLADLIFISSLGESDERKISLAHFSKCEYNPLELRTLSWDASDTYFHYLQGKLDLEKLRWPKKDDDKEAWREQWSSAFTITYQYVIRTSEQLAVEMAYLAVRIRDQVKTVFEYEVPGGPLHKLFESFKNVLIYDLKIDTFADMYAQTIAYGLFSARATQEGKFKIENMSAMVPNTNPFLKSLFEECTKIGAIDSKKLDLEELGVAELIKMLNDSDIETILQDFGRQRRGEDPVIHFYELFLKKYNPEQKVKRGIFYTPDPVVSFIVRSVDYLLRKEFDYHDGLADTSTTMPTKVKSTTKNGEVAEEIKQVPKVQILDPATGTGTFLKYVIKEIKKTFDEKNKDLNEEELRKEWNEYVDKNLLPRIFGFELLMAPHAVAHLKLGLELKETGYDFKSKKRLGVYLTNTLEGTHTGAGTLGALNWISEEVYKADEIKKRPISVIIGNPPYSVSSQNKEIYIETLMDDYKKDVRKERNIQPLSDDYIKFIRFAHWKVDQNGKGVVGFITNNSYLSGVIHRGMRKKLLESFDKIYILNLHGSSRIGEKPPKGGKDENVFDIQQGVAISIYVKLEKPLTKKKVYYADLWGLRDKKYDYLRSNNVMSTDWTELEPKDPYYFFVPKDFALDKEYNEFWKITEIFNKWSSGVKTHRDHFVVGFTKNEIIERLKVFISDLNNEIVRERLKLKDTGSWKLPKARQKIKRKEVENEIYHYAYRPFDVRWFCYEYNLIDRPRLPFMEHLLRENLAIATTRKLATSSNFRHIFLSSEVTDIGYISSKTSESCYFFPLHLYNYSQNNTKTSNLNSKLLKSLKEIYNKEPTPEEIFYYIYAILYSLSYRKRYAEFLKIDFPRIPFTSNYELFSKLSKLSEQLVSLHLMKSDKLDDLITTFEGEGNNEVGSIGENSYKNGRLYLNRTQYFDSIPDEVYNFYIGGYQVCQKWLKDRKGRTLSEEEIVYYQKIVVAINETIQIMKEIDEAIENYGGWPIK